MKTLIKFLGVFLAYGLTNSYAQWNNNGDNYTTGKLGIGTTNPGTNLGIVAQPQPYESFVNLKISDSPHDYFEINNATGAEGQFIPNIVGRHASDNREALFLSGYITQNNDQGSRPIMTFDSRIEGKPAETRPLFGWSSYGQRRMTLGANGNLGIGTSSSGSKLGIVSQPKTYESFVNLKISDSPHDYFEINNATGAEGQFIPNIVGRHASDNREALFLSGYITQNNDQGSRPIMTFDSRIEGKPAETRPLFGWSSYGQRKMTLSADGNLGIGTPNPGEYKLAVCGKIRAKEIKVETGWADFVFEDDYNLPTLKEVENHIKTKGHLKDIPSAKEVEENGIDLGEMNAKLLQKIEELTLYVVENHKGLNAQNKMIQQLIKENSILKSKIKKITN